MAVAREAAGLSQVCSSLVCVLVIWLNQSSPTKTQNSELRFFYSRLVRLIAARVLSTCGLDRERLVLLKRS